MAPVRPGGFDRIAPYYDLMARFVFGRSIVEAQVDFLPDLSAAENVLIVGGGSGWILQELYDCNPSCKVWYVDASPAMIARAKRICPYHDCTFICDSKLPARKTKFDGVITNFFLDLFDESNLTYWVEALTGALKPGGLWLIAEFIHGRKRSQRLLVRLMYWFFRATCSIEARTLPMWNVALAQQPLHKLKERGYGAWGIQACLLKRSEA